MMNFFSYLFVLIFYFLVLFLNLVLGRGGKDRGMEQEGEVNGIGMHDMKSTKNQ